MPSPIPASEDYVDRRVEDACRLTQLRIKALEDAVNKSEKMNDIRLNGMNEWREESKSRMETYVTKAEFCVALEKEQLIVLGRLRIVEVLILVIFTAVIGLVGTLLIKTWGG